MKKIALTVFLSAVALAAIIWACSYRISGLAWFPGFFVAVCCCIKVYDINANANHKNGRNSQYDAG